MGGQVLIARRALKPISRTIRTNTTIASCVYYRCTYHDKTGVALVSPSEQVKWNYEELADKIMTTAGGLAKHRYGQGDVVATDTHDGVGNLLLQLAASHLGMQVATVRSAKELEDISNNVYIKGAVMSSDSSFLRETSLEQKHVMKELEGKPPEVITDRSLDLAYYGSPRAITNREVYLHGVGIAGLLEITPSDKVCITAPLASPFGLGSAVAAIVRNATIFLPDVAKMDVDGSTLISTSMERASLYKGVNAASLRGGVLQVNDGYDLFADTEEIAGVQMRKVGTGQESEIMRPLSDACKDTYYSYK